MKFLAKHPDIQLRFFEKLKIMKVNPYDSTLLDIKSLQGTEKWAWRLRVWSYRFKYIVIDHDILIYFYDADSRWDIYK